MIPLTKEEEDNYNKENICYICKKEFNNDKVRDDCHFTGKIGELHMLRVI